MKIITSRLKSDSIYTISYTSINEKEGCFTLEDAWHVAKIQGQTRIPAGTYEIKLRTEGLVNKKYMDHYGPKFHKGMLWLQDVPGYEWIYIHKGNIVKHTEGCLLTGDIASLTKGQVGDSEQAYDRIYPLIAESLLAGEKVVIEIRDENYLRRK